MKPDIKFIPTEGPLPEADRLPILAQDEIRSTVPASTVAYQDGQLLLSRVGVLHMAEEVIAGRTVGNAEAAKAMKAQILRDYPKP